MAHGLIALSAYFLWRNNARWGWMTILLVLVLTIVIFMRDVDFSSNLGVQL